MIDLGQWSFPKTKINCQYTPKKTTTCPFNYIDDSNANGLHSRTGEIYGKEVMTSFTLCKNPHLFNERHAID